MKYKNILWDWNGTLMEDVGIAIDAVNIMLGKRGRDPINMTRYYECVDTPIIKFYERCFDMSKEDKDGILREYHDTYNVLAEHLPCDTNAYDAVKKLADAGMRQFVVSSCEENELKHWIGKYQISDLLEDVTGAGNIYAESKIDRAAMLMKKHELNADETVFIGDILHDLDTARALDVDCILVTYGHQSPEENKKTGCVTADSLFEITEILLKDQKKELFRN